MLAIGSHVFQTNVGMHKICVLVCGMGYAHALQMDHWGDGVHTYIRKYVHMWWLPWDTHSGLPMLRIRSTFSDLAPLSVRSTRTSFSLPFLLRNEDRSFMLKLYTGIQYSMYVRTDTPYSTHMHTQTLMHTPTYSTSYKNVNSLRPLYWYGYGRAIRYTYSSCCASHCGPSIV